MTNQLPENQPSLRNVHNPLYESLDWLKVLFAFSGAGFTALIPVASLKSDFYVIASAVGIVTTLVVAVLVYFFRKGILHFIGRILSIFVIGFLIMLFVFYTMLDQYAFTYTEFNGPQTVILTGLTYSEPAMEHRNLNPPAKADDSTLLYDFGGLPSLKQIWDDNSILKTKRLLLAFHQGAIICFVFLVTLCIELIKEKRKEQKQDSSPLQQSSEPVVTSP